MRNWDRLGPRLLGRSGEPDGTLFSEFDELVDYSMREYSSNANAHLKRIISIWWSSSKKSIGSNAGCRMHRGSEVWTVELLFKVQALHFKVIEVADLTVKLTVGL